MRGRMRELQRAVYVCAIAGGGYVCAATGMAAAADELGRVACALAMGAAVLRAILGNTIARWIGAFFGGLGGGHTFPHLTPAASLLNDIRP